MTALPITRASLQNLKTQDILRFQFNPESLSRTKSSQWTAVPNNDPQNQPPPQFAGHGSEQLSAKLLFDDTHVIRSGGGGDGPAQVGPSVDRLFDWLTIAQKEPHGPHPSPPTLRLMWGDSLSFTGVLKNVSVQYLQFGRDGTPVRATASITMQAVPDNPKGTNPTSGGLPGRTSTQVRDGDTLASIAYEHFGDPNLWRAIAASNGIDDPTRVPTGTRLLIPRRVDALTLNDGEAGHG
jgi:nucleoid-associated protein YgaU